MNERLRMALLIAAVLVIITACEVLAWIVLR